MFYTKTYRLCPEHVGTLSARSSPFNRRLRYTNHITRRDQSSTLDCSLLFSQLDDSRLYYTQYSQRNNSIITSYSAEANEISDALSCRC